MLVKRRRNRQKRKRRLECYSTTGGFFGGKALDDDTEVAVYVRIKGVDCKYYSHISFSFALAFAFFEDFSKIMTARELFTTMQ